MVWLGTLFVLVASSLNAVQTGCNTRLQKGVQQPLLAAAIVYAAGLSALLLALATVRAVKGPGSVPLAPLTRLPWWALVGGLLGACYILSMITQPDRIGAGAFMAVSLVTTIATSVLIDHFGWLGMRPHPATLWRIVGCVVMVVGVMLVARF